MGTKNTHTKDTVDVPTDVEILTAQVAVLTAQLTKREECRLRYYEQYDAQRRRANELEETCAQLKAEHDRIRNNLRHSEVALAESKGTVLGMNAVLDRYAPGPRCTQRTTTETSEPC